MRRRRSRGFSLLEVLAALSLFAIAASAMGSLILTSMRYTVRNMHASSAAMLAQQQIENLRSLDYPDIAGGTTTATMEGQSYSVATTVATDTPAAGMKDITVTVSWTGPEGSRSYAVRTIYTSITT